VVVGQAGELTIVFVARDSEAPAVTAIETSPDCRKTMPLLPFFVVRSQRQAAAEAGMRVPA
jgi:hypothetical protein